MAGTAVQRPVGAGVVERAGGMLALTLRVGVALAAPPFAWRRETAIFLAAVLRRTLPAIVLSIALWGFAGPGLQAGNFLVLFGSPDRAGGFMVVAILREFGTFVTATVVAGVAGTMLTAELGARRVRGELDALSVLAVDPVAALVAPRVLALVLALVGLDLIALIAGVAGGYVANVGVLGSTTGAFLSSFFANTTFVDLVASLVKVAIFGALIGVICAWHGLHASGGPEGVGRAVNRAVVGCLVAIFAVNLVFTQGLLAAFPQVGVLR
jgi:phospholipid/cholesterol/gamma-HCH transport system permease protein